MERLYRLTKSGRDAWETQDASVPADYRRILAFFALFVLINGAMVMGLAPVVGVPMPLLSYGGSSMMTIMLGFGLILSTRVHRYAELPKGQGLF